jgi:hypothetical protein
MPVASAERGLQAIRHSFVKGSVVRRRFEAKGAVRRNNDGEGSGRHSNRIRMDWRPV